MKLFSLYILFFFLVIHDPIFGQCLENSNFSNFCGTQLGSCPTFNSPCLYNWRRSHGTPQIFTNTSGKVYNYAYMWCSNTNNIFLGEGIFANYSFFANHTYTVTVTVQATSTPGSFLLFATTGLVEPGSPGCGDALPIPTTKQ